MKFEFEPDLKFFLGDFGEPIAWENQTLVCLFDFKHDPLAFGAGGRAIEAVVQAEDFAELAIGDTVEIRLKQYTVAELHPIQSGDFLRLILEEL